MSHTPTTRAENIDVLQQIAKRRGVSAEAVTMLEHIMAAESGGKQYAANPSSSARGCFQFIDSTWLGTMKKHAAALGETELAQQIYWNGAKKEWTINDPKLLKQALDKRYDVAYSCEMGILLTKDNQAALRAVTGKEPSAGELYLAHFLGANDARRVLQHSDSSANISTLLSADVMNSNKPIQLKKAGQSKFFADFTVADVQLWAAGKMNQELSYEQLSEQNRRASWRRRNPRKASSGKEDDYSDMVESLGDMSMSVIQFIGMIIAGIFSVVGSVFGVGDSKVAAAPQMPQTPNRPQQTAPARS
jgi:hypothetical protein